MINTMLLNRRYKKGYCECATHLRCGFAHSRGNYSKGMTTIHNTTCTVVSLHWLLPVDTGEVFQKKQHTQCILIFQIVSIPSSDREWWMHLLNSRIENIAV